MAPPDPRQGGHRTSEELERPAPRRTPPGHVAARRHRCSGRISISTVAASRIGGGGGGGGSIDVGRVIVLILLLLLSTDLVITIALVHVVQIEEGGVSQSQSEQHAPQ